MTKRIRTCVLSVIIALLFTGCSKEKRLFQDAEENISAEMDVNDGEMKESEAITGSITSFPEMYYNLCVRAQKRTWLILLLSITGGAAIYNLFRENKEVRQWAYGLLIIKIPLFIFIGTYIYPFFYGMLNLDEYSEGEKIAGQTLRAIYYNFCIYAKRWVPFVIILSILTGYVLYDLFKKNREVQKGIFGLLIIKIPVLFFVGIYIISFLYGILF